jgi:hypothetical protein
MNRIAAAVCAVILAVPAAAAPAKKKARPVSPLNSTSGVIVSLETKHGLHLTLQDGAGHLEHLALTRGTRVTRAGKKAGFKDLKTGDRVTKAVYVPATKRVVRMTVAAKDADDARPADAQGEVAGTDVLGGSISVRLGGGATMSFKVGDATKILREAAGAAPQPVALESVKVGERVEVRTKDWKTADEIHVRAPQK